MSVAPALAPATIVAIGPDCCAVALKGIETPSSIAAGSPPSVCAALKAAKLGGTP